MSIIEFHRIDQNNPGDFYSNPCRYFFTDRETTKIDIDNVKRTTWKHKDTIIVGGGGLIGNENFEPFMNRITTQPDINLLNDILETNLRDASIENRDLLKVWKEEVQTITLKYLDKIDTKIGPRILWGAGHNSRDKDTDSYSFSYPKYLNKFHLVGVRDWDTDYRWVPCPSCMHPAFNRTYEIKNEVVWFEHKKRLIEGKCLDALPTPRMLNTGQNLEQIAEFLGSAEVVVTNSYHGVYWATLLGRKVVCIPWGSKFNMFKHPPTTATEKNWVDKISEAIAYPTALEECKVENLKFFEDVIKLMNELNNSVE